MLMKASQLKDATVISLHTAHAVGRLAEPIISPHNLTVEGYYCEIAQKVPERPVLLTRDIRQVNGRKVFIDSTDELTAPEHLLRHKEVMALGFTLVDKAVHTQSGRKLGKVEQYVINDLNWQIQKIYVKQPIIKSLSTHSLILDRDQVVEVTDKQIVVDDALVGKPAIATPPAT